MQKTKWITSMCAFVVMSIMCVQFAGYNAKEKYLEVSKGFSIPVGNCVIREYEADVDCDGKNDKVYVYGEGKNGDAEYAERINLAVVYAKNGFVKKTNVSHIKGYVADVVVQDFTGNKNKDILLKTYVDDSRSAISVFVADLGYDIPKSVMSDSRGMSPSFAFSDGFVVNCSLKNGELFSVNLKNKKDVLVGNGFYNDEGILSSKEKIYAKPFSDINAIDYDRDLQYELEGVQSVVAGGNEVELFKVCSVQKFVDRSWELVKIEVKY